MSGRGAADAWYPRPVVAPALQIDLGPVQGLIARIVEKLQPAQIWLFGSRARGAASASSDWDLLAVVPDDLAEIDTDDPLLGFRLRKDLGVRADVLACRVSEFAESRDTPNTVCYDAAHEGLLLYER